MSDRVETADVVIAVRNCRGLTRPRLLDIMKELSAAGMAEVLPQRDHEQATDRDDRNGGAA